MNSNLKILITTVGAAVMAVAIVASASAQTRHQVNRPSNNQPQYQSTFPAMSAYGSEAPRDPHNDR
jgi:hypothetical protein